MRQPYRDRIEAAYRASVVDETFIASAYRAVFGTPEGAIVLDDIMQRICQVDDVPPLTLPVDPMMIVHHNALRYVGLKLYKLARDPSMNVVPDLKLQGDPDA